jgi:hypothetical protein
MRNGLRQIEGMSYHDHGQPLSIQVGQQAGDLTAIVKVEIAGGLVRKDYFGFLDKCAGDSDSLLLSTGHIGGTVMKTVTESHLNEYLLGAPPSVDGGNVLEVQCDLDVFQRRVVRQQIECLEYHPDPAGTVT